MTKVCDQLDCPLHPDYKEQEDEEIEDEEGNLQHGDIRFDSNTGTVSVYNPTMQSHTHNVGWAPIAAESLSINNGESKIEIQDVSIKIETPHVNCYLECLFCEHRRQIDMRREVIAMRAKKLLEE